MALRPTLCAALMLGTLAQAEPYAQTETPMTGDQFERYTLDRTYLFNQTGSNTYYGIELYLPDRRVVWAEFSDQCEDGTWFENDRGEICFLYPSNNGEERCWLIYKTGDQLRLEYMTDGSGADYQMTLTTDSVPCLGDYVGA